jgi:hypothetical protein
MELPHASIPEALDAIARFAPEGDVRSRIANLESDMRNVRGSSLPELLEIERIDDVLLHGALLVKRVSSQINILIHSIGILVSLPYILEEDETIESLSLGAGNTGRRFDLETDRRVAEFKFIQWRGGAESIRQNSIFIDLFDLAAFDTDRRRCLYVVDASYPLRFLNGGRAIASVLSKSNAKLGEFRRHYGSQYVTVSQYYNDVKDLVEIIDLADVVPELMTR